MSASERRRPGQRCALSVKGHVQSRTAPRGQVLGDGTADRIPWSIDGVGEALRIRYGNAVVDVDLAELLTAVGRSILTDYDDDYGLPLVQTNASRPDGSVHDVAEDGSLFYGNDRFTVHVRIMEEEWGLAGPVRLSIHDHHRNPDIPWRLLQRIKNEVCGPERWAVEWFPDEAHLVDEANERHLWVLGVEDVPGFAMLGGRVVSTPDDAAAVGAVQAPLPEWYPEAVTS